MSGQVRRVCRDDNVNRRDGNGNRNGNSNDNSNGNRNGNSNDNSNGCPAAPAATGGGRKRDALRGIVWVMRWAWSKAAQSRCTPLAFGAGRLLLGLFGANFAEEFFAAKFAFFLDDDFAEVGPGGF